MPPQPLSRRAFALSALGLAAHAVARPQLASISAGEVIDRIQANIGVEWAERTVDNIIHGSRDTAVQGIATTMMATLDVCQRAAAAGKNMVITHESTFFSHQDTVDELGDDPNYLHKLDFLKRHDMVVFHLHDHWHRRRPDGIAIGMARELGWEEFFSDPDNPRVFELPATTLADLAAEIAERLGASTVRVLGDPALPIRRVRTSWGYHGGLRLASAPGDFDVLICGETREWEMVEYVQDMITAGRRCGLILVGHIASEQAGMKFFAGWLTPLVPEVPIAFIPAKEPFWYPDA